MVHLILSVGWRHGGIEVPDLLPGDPADFQDPAYREAVVDLLGAISYGEISAFERLAEDAKMAPPSATRWRWRPWPRRSSGTSRGCTAAHRARRRPVRRDGAVHRPSKFHRHRARRLVRGLIKAYVGDGLAADFYREIAAYLDSATRDLVIASLEDSGQADFVVDRIRQAIAATPSVGVASPCGAVG